MNVKEQNKVIVTKKSINKVLTENNIDFHNFVFNLILMTQKIFRNFESKKCVDIILQDKNLLMCQNLIFSIVEESEKEMKKNPNHYD